MVKNVNHWLTFLGNGFRLFLGFGGFSVGGSICSVIKPRLNKVVTLRSACAAAPLAMGCRSCVANFSPRVVKGCLLPLTRVHGQWDGNVFNLDSCIEVLLNIPEYDLTPETLEEFLGEVIELVEEEPVTEDLFSPLEKRGLEPTLILSKTDHLLLENHLAMLQHKKDLELKDKQIDHLELQLKDVKQKRERRDQKVKQLTQQPNNSINTNNLLINSQKD